jgi:hypothetical protein
VRLASRAGRQVSGAPLSRAQQRADTRRERVEAIAAALDADR